MFISFGSIMFIVVLYACESKMEKMFLCFVAGLIFWTIPTIVIGLLSLMAYGLYDSVKTKPTIVKSETAEQMKSRLLYESGDYLRNSIYPEKR